MIIRDEADVTRAVLRVMERTTDPRLREIMVALIRHLHGFVRDVRLTEEEFEAATAILNEIGQQQTDTNNEVVLMAGSLGVSALVCLLNTGDRSETTQSMLGPFWRLNSPPTEKRWFHRAIADARANCICKTTLRGPDRRSNRRCRGRYLACFHGGFVREPRRRPGGHESSRQVHHG